jgi:23S rRNA (cytosine1962-C5)-methyltransferase
VQLSPQSLPILITKPWADYALIDSGGGRKYERYGAYHIIRPEAQALWRPRLPEWPAHAEYVGAQEEDESPQRATSSAEGSMQGRWRTYDNALPSRWPIKWGGGVLPAPVQFWASCTAFRHLAFFPDMVPHWAWLAHWLRPGDHVLNLFGYTGVASLVAARCGARVTHVDASKKALSAAVENQTLSGLQDAQIRWIVDDALKFVQREARRGRRYQCILLDPPKFGRGPNGEAWHLFEALPNLLHMLATLLDPERSALVLTVYAIRASALALGIALEDALGSLQGSVELGEMALAHEGDTRLLPTALFVRWQSASVQSAVSS